MDTNPTQYRTRIDPMMHSPHTMNAESDAGSESGAETDSTDVNGVNVPDARKGGGKMKEKLMRKERHLGKIKKQMHEKD